MVEYRVQREGSPRTCWVGKETAEVGFKHSMKNKV